MINPFDRRSGFTLTEVLVVILIIFVLAAVLVPTVTGLRDRATATGCASNMRQCIALSLMFASEQNGRLPRLTVNNGSLQAQTGKTPMPVKELTVSNPNVHFWPDLISTYAESASMFSCPKLKVNSKKALTTTGAYSDHLEVQLGIGINWPYMARHDSDQNVWTLLSSVPDQGRVVWFADAAGEVTGDWKKRQDVPGTGNLLFRAIDTNGKAAIARHGEKINVGFVDGHVSQVNPSEINWGSTDTDRSKYTGYTKF